MKNVFNFDDVKVSNASMDEVKEYLKNRIDSAPHISIEELENMCDDSASAEPYEDWPKESFEDYMERNKYRIKLESLYYSVLDNIKKFFNKTYNGVKKMIHSIFAYCEENPFIVMILMFLSIIATSAIITIGFIKIITKR